MKLEKNMSSTDRWIRVLIALVFGYLYFSGIVGGVLGIILLVVGIVFILTSVVSWCPIYALFNISSLKKGND
ncbi:MAG: DUF2892 domain-containing protein [Anaerolineales bacterium]|jgi:uncharacterized membrane protein YtjA (UPF0391 family)